MLDLALLWHGSAGDQSYKHSLALFLKPLVVVAQCSKV